MPAQAARQDELRALIARLEQSGLADRREDVARLLAQSRALLAASLCQPAPPRLIRRRRPRPMGARARLRAALLLLLDATALGGLAFAAVGMGVGALAATGGGVVLAAALLWGVLRWGGAPALLAEGVARLAYGLRWGALWLAEPFHLRAWERLEALLDAREVMRAWRRHRADIARPGLPEVEAFLAARYGATAARRFQAAVQARQSAGWTLRGGSPAEAQPRPEPRLLRWSVLIRLFEAVAAGGALWQPEPLPGAETSPGGPAPAAPAEAARPDPEALAREARREALRDLIRRKRQDITTAHNWKLKTAAEIAQRDAYLEGLRAEIAAMEKELAALERDQHRSVTPQPAGRR
jgi:hypothetical protein